MIVQRLVFLSISPISVAKYPSSEGWHSFDHLRKGAIQGKEQSLQARREIKLWIQEAVTISVLLSLSLCSKGRQPSILSGQ